MAQNVRLNSSSVDEGTEYHPPLTQINTPETDNMSIWTLPSTGGTSGNTRAPGNTYRYQRTEYIITAAEMAKSGFPVGAEVNSIGFLIATAGATSQTGTFTCYLKNTTDLTYSLGTNWDVTGFTTVSVNNNWTVPIAVGSYEIPFTGGSTFVYTGGGVYVAWEFSNPAGTLGTTALVASCDYLTANSLMGARSSTAMPTALTASNFRPATIFGNTFYTDIAQVTNIYTLARNPIPYGAPTPVDVRVSNVSATASTFDVTLTVKDPTNTITRFTSTQTVSALAAGASSILTFNGWNPTIQEDVNITATASTVAGENFIANNTMTIPCSVNNNLYSYNFTTSGAGGLGFTYPTTGIFSAKYTMHGQGKVTGANLVIGNSAVNTGNTIFAVAMNSAGTILAQSADYVITAGDLGTNKSFTFPTPPVFTDEDYYIGMGITAGTVQWYPMGYFSESPLRENTFFESAITGGPFTYTFLPADGYRLAIEAIVAPNFNLPAVVTTAATPVAGNTATVNGTVMANSNTVAVSFEYGTTTAYGNTATGIPSSVTGSAVTPVSANLTGLLPFTTYHYRAVGTIGLFKFYGSDLTFTTTAPPPTVVTTAVSGVGITFATLNGTVNANTASSTVTFEYGLTTSYGTTVNAIPATVTGNVVTPVLADLTGLLLTTTYHYRVKAVSVGGTSTGNDMTFTTGCQQPVPAGTITGLAGVCQGATAVSYTVPDIVNATSYTWTLPAGASIATGSGTNSITVDYSTSAASGDITVYGTSDCGNGTPSSLAVTVNPAPVPSLTVGPLSVCAGTAGVVYQTQAGMTDYTWTISSGGIITAGAGTNSITVTWNTIGAQTLSLNYTNGSGCAAASPAVFNITIVDRPVPTISGPTNACLGFATNVYTTQSGNTGYTWSVSPGGIITAGTGTEAITVTWNTLGAKTVSVNYTVAAGCNAVTPSVLNVTVNPTPSPTISGPNELCAGATGAIYTTEPGFSNYNWNISYGGIITSGLNTNVVTVDWATAGSRSISVNYNNSFGCGAVNPASMSVNINSAPVPIISGPDQLCQGATAVAYSTQMNYSDYIWTVSSGGTITSGNGTNAITVNWNESGNQSVSVEFTNDFGCQSITPTVLNVALDPLPATAGPVLGTTPVCAGSTDVTYTTGPVTLADTYVWTLPSGATIVNGAGTRTIKVIFANNASSGVIKVSGSNACGLGVSSPNFNLVVTPLPATPVITQNGAVLTSSASSGNQWYLDGAIIPGATNQQYTVLANGTYTVVVTSNGCSSSPSDGILILTVGISIDKADRNFSIYPNPNNGEFNIKVETLNSEQYTIEIYNNLGASVWKQEDVTVNGSYKAHVVLSESPSGIYMVALRNKANTIVKKLIIMN
jgi:hypothetical protein